MTKIKEPKVEKAIIATPQELQLAKPEQDTKFAQNAAKYLVDIIKKNNWSRKLGGQSEHIQYEGWQTAGKYYGYTVRTHDAEFIEYGETWGFKAKATVVNEKTGVEVGGAEALCMSDEANWKNKPKFQLASMAQTRAGSKALRQILGFVVALAGYSPTPAEEMDGVTASPKAFIDPSNHHRAVQREPSVDWTEEDETLAQNSLSDPADPLHCSVCKKDIPQNVSDYSIDHYGKPLCFSDQKKQQHENL